MMLLNLESGKNDERDWGIFYINIYLFLIGQFFGAFVLRYSLCLEIVH